MSENIGQVELANKLIDFVVLPFSDPGRINDRSLFSKAFQYYISLGQPIQVAGFIGQGGKDHLGKSDMGLLDKYHRFSLEMNRYYSGGAQVSLIGADIHGIENSIENRGYLELIQVQALRFGFNWRLLSELYREKGLVAPSVWDNDRFYGRDDRPEYQEWVSIPADIKASLRKAADRHNGKGFDS
ncbi:hypothetical protein HYW87_03870, partial [Candidatus Roizmanbacteria bacterium]|nr:hypothetical protein [Candidatus Roizmanbacteria bacterium]